MRRTVGTDQANQANPEQTAVSRQAEASAHVRQARLDDAPELLRLMEAVDCETPYMIYGRAERGLSSEDLRLMLLEAGLKQGLALFVAQPDRELAGYAVAMSGGLARTRHNVRVSALGVLRAWWRKGLGRALLEQVELWAVRQGAKRLELETMAANDAARRLYEDAGFVEEGRRRRAFLVAGSWMDALMLGKLLD